MERRQRHVFQIQPQKLAADRPAGHPNRMLEASPSRYSARNAPGARRDGQQREEHVLEVGRIIRLVGVAGADAARIVEERVGRSEIVEREKNPAFCPVRTGQRLERV